MLIMCLPPKPLHNCCMCQTRVYQIFDESVALSYLTTSEVVIEMLHIFVEMLHEELPKASLCLMSHDLKQFKSYIHGWNGSVGYFVKADFSQELSEMETLCQMINENSELMSKWSLIEQKLIVLIQEGALHCHFKT